MQHGTRTYLVLYQTKESEAIYAKGAQIVRVAFTYIGTVVGAGFASGQEILQFFTRYGWLASLTIALSTMLFIWIGIKLMLMAHDLKAESYEDLNQVLFGRKNRKMDQLVYDGCSFWHYNGYVSRGRNCI